MWTSLRGSAISIFIPPNIQVMIVVFPKRGLSMAVDTAYGVEISGEWVPKVVWNPRWFVIIDRGLPDASGSGTAI